MTVFVTKPKTPEEISSIRESGKMLGHVLEILKKSIQPGISTKGLAIIAQNELAKIGGEPAFLGYQGFPDVACVSINEEVVHGIPSPDRVVSSGDIVSVDFGVVYRGMITDAAFSVIAGAPKSREHLKLLETTKKSLLQGVKSVKNNAMTGDIGYSIEQVLSKKNYGIVRDLVGHGVGHYLHEEPNIPNYGKRGKGFCLQTGMTIAVEPMSTLGSPSVYIRPDGWTVATQDGSLSAHFEHTILVTENGYEILTGN